MRWVLENSLQNKAARMGNFWILRNKSFRIEELKRSCQVDDIFKILAAAICLELPFIRFDCLLDAIITSTLSFIDRI